MEARFLSEEVEAAADPSGRRLFQAGDELVFLHGEDKAFRAQASQLKRPAGGQREACAQGLGGPGPEEIDQGARVGSGFGARQELIEFLKDLDQDGQAEHTGGKP